jgi:GntR family transcriptional regulator/MocR family aminotransferase
VVVCGGFAQGLTVLCRALRSLGVSVVAMEDPWVPAHRSAASATPLTVVSVPVDGEGMRVDALATRSPGAAFVTPAHQCMLGMAMTPGRRAALLRWAADAGAILVEDDYDGEFRYDRQPVGALQGLDPERVIYAGTASKTLAPGLRLAWLVVPPQLADAVVEAKRLTDGLSGALDQLTLADFIESGGFDRHIRRMRLRYMRRRDLLVAALAERAPALRPSGIAAGLHVILSLPSHGPTEDEAVAHAARRGVALLGLGPFFADRDNHVPGLVVGYGTPPEHGFETALRSLVDVLGELWPV